MRRLVSRLIVLLSVVTCAVLARAAQDPRQMGGAGLRVFEHAEFAGASATLTRDTPDFRSIDLDNRVSSLRVAGREVWEVCDGRNYTGRCEVVSGTESDLRAHGWNDRISSARRVRGGGGGSRPPYGGRVGLVLYSDRRFSGQELFLDRAVRDLRRYNFNDRAESLRVLGGQSWEVCENIEFNDCRVVSGDISDLRSIGLREMISAVRPLGRPR